jgi:hypothetical protein
MNFVRRKLTTYILRLYWQLPFNYLTFNKTQSFLEHKSNPFRFSVEKFGGFGGDRVLKAETVVCISYRYASSVFFYGFQNSDFIS